MFLFIHYSNAPTNYGIVYYRIKEQYYVNYCSDWTIILFDSRNIRIIKPGTNWTIMLFDFIIRRKLNPAPLYSVYIKVGHVYFFIRRPYLLFLYILVFTLQYSQMYREGVSFIGHKDEITGLALGSSDTLLSVSADGRVSSWDLRKKIR